MTDRDFIYWLQGFFELSEGDEYNLRKDQVKTIKKHIDLVERERDRKTADSFLVGVVSSIGAILGALDKDYTDENSVFAVDCLGEVLGSVLTNVTNKDDFFLKEMGKQFQKEMEERESEETRSHKHYVDVFEGGSGFDPNPSPDLRFCSSTDFAGTITNVSC